MTIPLSRRAISAFTRVFDALWRTTFVIGANARRQNTITSSAKPVRCEERAGVVPAFRSSVTSVSPDQAFKKQIIEGSGTPANAGLPTAASCDAAAALLERARLSAFHRGSRLRELSHPKGSASGQASWDLV